MKNIRSGGKNLDFPIVVIGASAGGLEAFKSLFKPLPAQPQMSIIVIQHLDPEHESTLHELIQRFTSVSVEVITDDAMIENNRIYVIPAGYIVTVWNGKFQLSDYKPTHGWPQTINQFLKSLATDQSGNLAVIICSGAGDDGSEGARAIHKAGGLVIAQDPETAKQKSMPNSVIATGLAKAILSPDKMVNYLLNYFGILDEQIAEYKTLFEDLTDSDLTRVIRRLQQWTGYDFSGYKPSTLRRQLSRRMGYYGTSGIDEYLDILAHQPDEAVILSKHLLINVTEFFRDPSAFESLEQQALKPLLKALDSDVVFRAWVPGCASGEEAISIAIVIYEILHELDKLEMEVRIFATDIHEDLIQHARQNVYPTTITQNISPERLSDHFIEEEGHYRVRNHINRMIIWAEHNLVEHPPFTNLYFISCRNVLIYFQRRLQKRILSLFQFALNQNGILFLGTSETVEYTDNAFEVVDNREKIYKRTSASKNEWMRLDRPLFTQLPDNLEQAMSHEPASDSKIEHVDRELTIIKDMLTEQYNATCAIVDENYQIKYTYGEIDRYLKFVTGRSGVNHILSVAREGLDVELTIALHQVFDGEESVTRKGVWVRTNGEERIINLIVKSINDNVLGNLLKLVIFERSSSETHLQDIPTDEADGTTIKRLQAELKETKRALQKVTQALQAKSEELTSSMEEIRSANEEIQTNNEELRTSKEELESMNEELNTLNTQLIDQNGELTHANNTLHNFLQASEVAMIFLDLQLAIREFTYATTHIFSLRKEDINRPLAEIKSKLIYDEMLDDAEHVLNTLQIVEKIVQSTEGEWYKINIRPYYTTHNAIEGLVLVFSNITTEKQSRDEAIRNSNYVREIINTIDHSLLELSRDLRITAANRAFYEQFQVESDDVVGVFLNELGDGQWDIPELRHLLTDVIPEKRSVKNYVVTHEFPNIGKRIMRLNAHQIGFMERILLIITEVVATDSTDPP